MNINPKTGTPYGVAHRNAIDPEMLDRIYNNGTNLRVASFMSQMQGDIAQAVEQNDLTQDAADEIVEKYPSFDFEDVVEAIEGASDTCDIVTDVLLTNFSPLDDMPESDDDQIEYRKNDLHLRLSGEYIFVCESPVTVEVNNCSPCFPNAGDLGTVGKRNIKCYGLPLEWFEEGRCPYEDQL